MDGPMERFQAKYRAGRAGNKRFAKPIRRGAAIHELLPMVRGWSVANLTTKCLHSRLP